MALTLHVITKTFIILCTGGNGILLNTVKGTFRLPQKVSLTREKDERLSQAYGK